MAETITFSKTKLFFAGHKKFGDIYCPMMGRMTLTGEVEYILTHDCSSLSINYNIIWLTRWMDEFGNAGSTDKVVGMA